MNITPATILISVIIGVLFSNAIWSALCRVAAGGTDVLRRYNAKMDSHPIRGRFINSACWAGTALMLLAWPDPATDPVWFIPAGWICVGFAFSSFGSAIDKVLEPFKQ